MKLVNLIFDAAIEDVVQELLKQSGINCYMKIPKVVGKLGDCEPLLGTHIWPGHALWYMIPLGNSELETLRPGLKELVTKYANKGVRVFLMPVEEI